MKQMKSLQFSSYPKIIILLFIMAFSSCKKEEATMLYQSYGIAYPVEGESYSYKIETDFGNTLIPTSNNYIVDTITRVFATFSFINDADFGKDIAEVNFNYLDDILYKNITADTTYLGNSETFVKKNNIWQSAQHNILNISFDYFGGGTTHFINLFYNDTLSNADTVLLEFKHNKNDDLLIRPMNGLVSFNMNSLEDYVTVEDSVVLKVTFNKGNTFSYIDEWFGVYKPD